MTKKALCVGINTYPTAPLSGCVADAQLWAETLSGFQTTLLLDNDATRQNILTNLTRFITESAPHDILVFQYSGHGTQLPDMDGDEPDAWDEAICPVDFHRGQFVTDDDLAPIFAKLPSQVSLTVLMDCCFSGTNTRFAIGGLPGLATDTRRPRYVVTSTGIPRAPAVPDPNRNPANMKQQVLSACRSDEVAYEVDGQGVFTRIATNLIRGGFKGSNIGLVNAIEDELGERPFQHPTLDCARSDRTRKFLSGRR